MFSRVTLCAAASALLLTGCQDDTSTTTSPPSPGTSTAVASADPGQGQVLRSRGFTVTVPAGWKQVDPTTDTSEVVQVSWGIKDNPFGDVVLELNKELKDKGAVWALDPASASGSFAVHLDASCTSGGLTGSDLESLRKKAQAKDGAQVEDTTVSGKPALKISVAGARAYDQTSYRQLELRVPVSDDEFCSVSLEGPPEALTPAVADPILASFALA
ncbi:hypothetical protein ABGB12_03795 [Actinocorallia sp. B10E7]|uniref:hypothetical protein n=1 Tax=Actinocorallia sp. B10E7 TaxID=3153558 RepID=UPI00325EE2A1